MGRIASPVGHIFSLSHVMPAEVLFEMNGHWLGPHAYCASVFITFEVLAGGQLESLFAVWADAPFVAAAFQNRNKFGQCGQRCPDPRRELSLEHPVEFFRMDGAGNPDRGEAEMSVEETPFQDWRRHLMGPVEHL